MYCSPSVYVYDLGSIPPGAGRTAGEWILFTFGRRLEMLVLSRQKDESIIIGDNIVITVVDIRGDKVRLGIDAPRETTVHREEVYQAIQRENQRNLPPVRTTETLLEQSK
jgi:carbon storage regulator